VRRLGISASRRSRSSTGASFASEKVQESNEQVFRQSPFHPNLKLLFNAHRSPNSDPQALLPMPPFALSSEQENAETRAVYEEVKKLQTRVTSLEAELKSAKVSPTSPCRAHLSQRSLC
jgi:hypothetical protein